MAARAAFLALAASAALIVLVAILTIPPACVRGGGGSRASAVSLRRARNASRGSVKPPARQSRAAQPVATTRRDEFDEWIVPLAATPGDEKKLESAPDAPASLPPADAGA